MQLSSIIIGILGGQEIVLILIVILVLFGGKKIPELMRGLGKGVGEYNKAKNEVLDELSDMAKSKEEKQKTTETKEEKPAHD
ncbi:MAG: twin-arginine translocase TatA/TatE family subunit [Bacteroidota bacterium]